MTTQLYIVYHDKTTIQVTMTIKLYIVYHDDITIKVTTDNTTIIYSLPWQHNYTGYYDYTTIIYSLP